MRARLPASVDPEVIKDRIVAAVTLATRDTPHVSLEEFDGGSIVVRIRATPVESREGGKLAREVLTAVSALHEENLAPEHSVA